MMKSIAWALLCLVSGYGMAQTWNLPLSTSGPHVVDAAGDRVKLKSVNWYGSHTLKQVPEGLDKQPIDHIVSLILEAGFNSVRLPFSNQMLRDRNPVADHWVQANRDFQGLTPLQVFDRTVESLTSAGVAVIINNHTTYSEWCCGWDINGLWYAKGVGLPFNFSQSDWERDTLQLVQRYSSNPLVVGYDLRNEVRTAKTFGIIPDSPTWGDGRGTDWHLAATRLGNKILSINQNVLIIVEGINWTGLVPPLRNGHRPHLMGAAQQPIRLIRPDKLVYSAHNYAFTGPSHSGNHDTTPNEDRYSDLSPQELKAVVQREWNFVRQAGRFYTAPVWIGEFGVGKRTNLREKRWFINFVNYLVEEDLGFAYWPLNHESYGLVNEDWSELLVDWRTPHLNRLLNSPNQPTTGTQKRFSLVDIARGNDQQQRLYGDLAPWHHKGVCPQGWRLTGVSQNHRGLCYQDRRLQLGRQISAVLEEVSSRHGDWAPYRTKYTCPAHHVVTGLTMKNNWTSGITCNPLTNHSINRCSAYRFGSRDNRRSPSGGDWAYGSRKGQCHNNQVLAGIAHQGGTAKAILCCSIH